MRYHPRCRKSCPWGAQKNTYRGKDMNMIKSHILNVARINEIMDRRRLNVETPEYRIAREHGWIEVQAQLVQDVRHLAWVNDEMVKELLEALDAALKKEWSSHRQLDGRRVEDEEELEPEEE